jgi:hypothetical protein
MVDVKKTQVMFECDLCGEPAKSVTIGFRDEMPWTVDLCEDHAEPLRSLESRSRPSGRPRRPAVRAPKTKKGGSPKATHKVSLS